MEQRVARCKCRSTVLLPVVGSNFCSTANYILTLEVLLVAVYNPEAKLESVW